MTSTRLLSTTSDTLTPVAVDKPTFLTVIVYLSLSPTRTLVTLTDLLTVKLTNGLTSTETLDLNSVLFSSQVAFTLFVNKPSVVVKATIWKTTDWPSSN